MWGLDCIITSYFGAVNQTNLGGFAGGRVGRVPASSLSTVWEREVKHLDIGFIDRRLHQVCVEVPWELVTFEVGAGSCFGVLGC